MRPPAGYCDILAEENLAGNLKASEVVVVPPGKIDTLASLNGEVGEVWKVGLGVGFYQRIQV